MGAWSGGVAKDPRTVSEVARRMGLTRQNLQRSANRLLADGLRVAHPKPGHRTARPLGLTEEGSRVMAEVDARQRAWALRIASGPEPWALEGAEGLLAGICVRREDEPAEATQPCP